LSVGHEKLQGCAIPAVGRLLW